MKNISDLTMSGFEMMNSKDRCNAFDEALKIIDKNIFLREPTIKFVLYFETEMANYSESDNFVESVRDFVEKHPTSFPSKKTEEPQYYLSDNGFVNTKSEAVTIRDPEIVETVEEWLRDNAIPSKKPNKSSSYVLKEVIEHELDIYISNGAFIQACINFGIKVVRIDGGANGYIYADFIGTNTIKKACKLLNLTYAQLGERIGYGEEAISKASRTEEISRPMAAAIELLLENNNLKKETKMLDDLKSVLSNVLCRK